MSHVSRIDVKVTSLLALRSAVARLGGIFYENQKTHRFYSGQKRECDHAFSFPGCQYEVGVLKLDSGPNVEEYSLAWDSYEQSLAKAMGGYNADGFKQAYALEAAIEAMAAEGATLLGETTREDGTVELEFAGL